MDAYDGVRARPRMETPISPKLNIMAGRRPCLSAHRPITTAPIGRSRKPTPKVTSVRIRLRNGVRPGKKVWAICEAKVA